MLKQPEKQGFSFEGMAQENPYDEGIFTPSLLPQLTKQAPKQQIAQPNYVPDPVYAMLSDIDPKIAKKHLEYQSLTDRLIDAAQAKAQIRLQNAAPKTMGKEESVAVALGEALAKLGGARAQYAEGFSQNYTQSRQQQLDRENQQNALRAVQDYEVQQAMAEADIFGLGEQRKLVTGELEGLYDERKQVYDVIIEQEKTRRALEVQDAMKDRQISVEQVKAANREKLEEEKRKGATDEEIRRVEELTTAAYERYKQDPAYAGLDDGLILAMASNLAWSEYDKVRLGNVGQGLKNDLDSQLNPIKVQAAQQELNLLTQEYEFLKQLNPLKIKEYGEKITNLVVARENIRSQIKDREARAQERAEKLANANRFYFEDTKAETVKEQEGLIKDIQSEIGNIETAIRSYEVDLAKTDDAELKKFYQQIIKEDRAKIKDAQARLAKEQKRLQTIKSFNGNFNQSIILPDSTEPSPPLDPLKGRISNPYKK